MLVELIDRLDESIGSGASVATLRAQLSVIREQVEAVEAEIQRLKAQLKEHEAKPQSQNLAQNKDVLKKGDKDLLVLFFKSSGYASLEGMARTLRLSESIVHYHADRLREAKMIQPSHIATRAGLMYSITPKGRAYVVENKLAE